MKKLSVVMPVYNEQDTIEEIIKRVLEVPVPKELVIVDDRSQDKTWSKLTSLSKLHAGILLFRHDSNRGKGAALRTGFQHLQGDLTVIQDADLEYNPMDYLKLLRPIEDGIADVVYGTRFSKGFSGVSHLTHALANRFLTALSNWCSRTHLSDMETCYKMFKTSLVKGLTLTSERFGIEPELTARFARMGARIYEVPISYRGRTYAAGKKIGFSDGLEAIYAILKYNLIASQTLTRESDEP